MLYFIFHKFNIALSSSEFLISLNYFHITLMFKKDDETEKADYRPISILSNSVALGNDMMLNIVQ